MIPLRILGSNCTMKAPKGMEDRVADLSVFVQDGISYSRWEPTPEELAILVNGGSVELAVMGGHPPVKLTAQPAAKAVGRAVPVAPRMPRTGSA